MAAALIVTTGVLDPEGMLKGFGSLAFVAALVILFVECGVIFGAVLPGDSLLFIVGTLIATGFISVPLIAALPLMIAAAFAGNVVGYWTGAKIGPALFRRPDSKLFRQQYLDDTNAFFSKHGSRAIVLARFVPIVRSVITSVAGIAKMDYRTFVTYSGIGAVAWVLSMTLAGYFLGTVPLVADNIEAVTIGIIVLSLVPVVIESRRHRR